MSDRYDIHTRPWDESKDRTYVAPDGKGFCNWHWKLTRDEPTPMCTIDGLHTVVVASGFASTRHRARSKAEKAARKNTKRRADAASPERQEETYAYEPDGG